MAQAWDESFDAVIVGAGAAGLTAAITAAAAGLKPLVVEKQPVWGGSSALSGGGIWVPFNSLMQKAGGGDTLEAALTYLDNTVENMGPATSRERQLAFLNTAPEMIDFLLAKGVELEQEPTQPDYHAERPGGRKGRLMEPVFTNGKRLGPWLETLNPAPRPYAVKTGEGAKVGRAFSNLESTLTVLRVILRHRFAQLRGWAPMTSGAALMAQLMVAAQRAGVPVRLRTPLKEVVMEDGRAVGALVTDPDGRVRRIEARAGVILCAGGFAHDAELRSKHQGVDGSHTSAAGGDTGEVIRMADGLGAQIALMDQAWWGPSVIYPGGVAGFTLWERALPGSIIVNASGERFTNEAQSYNVFGQEMLRQGIKEAWLIIDGPHRRRYVFGGMPPGQTPKAMFDSGFFKRADSIEELARKCGIDAAGLKATVERFNGFARRGVDEDFGRGSHPYDNYWGDTAHKPNPNLGPLERGPFLATRVVVGDLGTRGGYLTDENGRVIGKGGEPIEGLYASGNVSASVMGSGYPGPGITLGPAMTFAYLAARHAAKRASNASL
jgi:3-oxosteroid 1-dehydrogenase